MSNAKQNIKAVAEVISKFEGCTVEVIENSLGLSVDIFIESAVIAGKVKQMIHKAGFEYQYSHIGPDHIFSL